MLFDTYHTHVLSYSNVCSWNPYMLTVCYIAHTGLASSNADVEQYWDVSVSAT